MIHSLLSMLRLIIINYVFSQSHATEKYANEICN